MKITIEMLQKELLKLHSKNNFLESELNEIKLMLEGKNNGYEELKKCLISIKEEIKNAFEDLEKEDLDALYGTLLQLSNLTNNVYLG